MAKKGLWGFCPGEGPQSAIGPGPQSRPRVPLLAINYEAFTIENRLIDCKRFGQSPGPGPEKARCFESLSFFGVFGMIFGVLFHHPDKIRWINGTQFATLVDVFVGHLKDSLSVRQSFAFVKRCIKINDTL